MSAETRFAVVKESINDLSQRVLSQFGPVDDTLLGTLEGLGVEIDVRENHGLIERHPCLHRLATTETLEILADFIAVVAGLVKRWGDGFAMAFTDAVPATALATDFTAFDLEHESTPGMQDHKVCLRIDGPTLTGNFQTRDHDILIRELKSQALKEFGLSLIELDRMKSVGNASRHWPYLPKKKLPASLLRGQSKCLTVKGAIVPAASPQAQGHQGTPPSPRQLTPL